MKIFTRVFLFGTLFLLSDYSFSQSNGCGSAPTLAIGDCDDWTNNGDNNDNNCPSCVSNQGSDNWCYRDIWYTFTGDGNNLIISMDIQDDPNVSVSVYEGVGCPSGAAALQNPDYCAYIYGENAGGAQDGSLSFPTTNGETYYIRIQRHTGNNGEGDSDTNDNVDGEICLDISPALAGDDPCTATSLNVNSYCNSSTYTNVGATETPGTPGCAGWAIGTASDVWFEMTVPSTGLFTVQTQDVGGMNNSGLAVYSSATNDCSNLTLIQCDNTSGPGSMSQVDVTTAMTPGDLVWVRVWENGNDNNGAFGICAYELSECNNNANNNDFCESPATLIWDPTAQFQAATAASYTEDDPAGMDANGNATGFGCGSLHNNSWFAFEATDWGSPPYNDTFSIILVENCVDGIQAHVYDVTNNASGCCTAFAGVSNCEGQIQPADAPIDIIATGLTPDSTYVLMIDGWAGANCDFTIDGWQGYNILPVELIQLAGITLPDRNVIEWKTASEYNNDYFNVLRSFDGVNFEIIDTKSGQGTTVYTTTYQVEDYEIRSGLVYYQIEQFDYDGKSEKSSVISVNRKFYQPGLVSVYPNPTEGIYTVEVNVSTPVGAEITIESVNGKTLETRSIENKGTYKISFDSQELKSGMYLVRYRDENLNNTKKLIIK